MYVICSSSYLIILFYFIFRSPFFKAAPKINSKRQPIFKTEAKQNKTGQKQKQKTKTKTKKKTKKKQKKKKKQLSNSSCKFEPDFYNIRLIRFQILPLFCTLISIASSVAKNNLHKTINVIRPTYSLKEITNPSHLNLNDIRGS